MNGKFPDATASILEKLKDDDDGVEEADDEND